MSEPTAAAGHPVDTAGYIMHHVRDGHEWELPFAHGGGLAGHVDLSHALGHWVLPGTTLDVTPTKAVVMLWLAALVVIGGLMWSMRGRGQSPKGRLQTTVETLFLFVRDEIARKNIGHHGDHYVPYLATAFFFILTANMLGLLPYAATATANLNVTLVLAGCTFVVTQVAGMREQGVVGYWTHLVPGGTPWWLYPLLLPIEIIGLFTKPIALMIRLFANMVAGHIVIFFLIGLIFILQTPLVAPISVAFAFGIYLLEIFVALIQAFIFTMLSAVFIGLASHSH